jgi:pimeloyl-ACP methyl ester carboxylesterase
MNRPIVFIPGLGADRRLFSLQKSVFKNGLTPQWLKPLPHELLSDYAKRWSKFLHLKPGVCLIGVSFGGMVALEMAKWVKPKAVILIGSCRSSKDVPFILRMAGSLPIWPWVGKGFTRIFPRVSGWFLGAETQEQSRLLIRMYLETPNDFLNWTVDAIRGWTGVPALRSKVYHIHGDKDHLIPVRNIRPNQMVQGGGHLINLTHSKQVNNFIKKCLK